jgi:hypothetical protein
MFNMMGCDGDDVGRMLRGGLEGQTIEGAMMSVVVQGGSWGVSIGDQSLVDGSTCRMMQPSRPSIESIQHSVDSK